MSTDLKTQTGESVANGSAKDGRRRPQITMTVHPDTVGRLRQLCNQYHQSKGQIADKLILALWAQTREGLVFCVTGEPCRFNRKDVPPIF